MKSLSRSTNLLAQERGWKGVYILQGLGWLRLKTMPETVSLTGWQVQVIHELQSPETGMTLRRTKIFRTGPLDLDLTNSEGKIESLRIVLLFR